MMTKIKIKNQIYNQVIVLFVIFLKLTTNLTFAHREHKVHNIVLYPDKHSWCKTLAIKQVISYPGCKSEEIDNNVCVGTCFSYSIPHTEPSDPGEVIVPYCDSCQPSDTAWHHVTLECSKNSIDDAPPQLVKRVQIINNCSCTSCEKSLLSTIHQSNQFNDEDDNDLIMSHVHYDVPDVLKILNRNNETLQQSSQSSSSSSSSASASSMTATTTTITTTSTTNDNNQSIGINVNYNDSGNGHYSNNSDKMKNQQSNLNGIGTNYDKFKDIKEIVNHKIIQLLKNIQENNSVHDKEQLMDLLRMIQGPTANTKLNDKSIEDFVNSLHSENIQLDIPRLREILIKFEHSKFYEKHRKYNYENSNTIDHQQQQQEQQQQQQQHQQSNQHHSHHHLVQHSHHILDETNLENNKNSIKTNTNNDDDDDDDNLQQQHHHNHHQQQQQHQQQSHHHHNHHHIGENIIGHGHLTRGPHGALVIEPDTRHLDLHSDHHDDDNGNISDDQIQHQHSSNQIQHEKLDVNPHELKPNHAGTLFTYSGHSTIENRKP